MRARKRFFFKFVLPFVGFLLGIAAFCVSVPYLLGAMTSRSKSEPTVKVDGYGDDGGYQRKHTSLMHIYVTAPANSPITLETQSCIELGLFEVENGMSLKYRVPFTVTGSKMEQVPPVVTILAGEMRRFTVEGRLNLGRLPWQTRVKTAPTCFKYWLGDTATGTPREMDLQPKATMAADEQLIVTSIK